MSYYFVFLEMEQVSLKHFVRSNVEIDDAPSSYIRNRTLYDNLDLLSYVVSSYINYRGLCLDYQSNLSLKVFKKYYSTEASRFLVWIGRHWVSS